MINNSQELQLADISLPPISFPNLDVAVAQLLPLRRWFRRP